MVRLWKPLWLVLMIFWPLPGEGVEFADVAENARYRTELKILVDLGAVAGVKSTSGEILFQPDRLVTRAEFLKICLEGLARGLHPTDPLVVPSPDAAPFVDVPVSEWYAGYIALAKRWGIVDLSLTHFNPGSAVTRRDAVRFVLKTLNLNGGARTMREGRFFPDTPTEADIYTAFAAHLVNGYPDGTFRPNRALNRVEAVLLVAKALANLEEALPFRFEVTAFASSNSPIDEIEAWDLGIRLNNPEDNSNLVKIHVYGDPPPGGGTYYALRRTNASIKVWPDREKSQPAYLDDNDTYVFSSAVGQDMYVENVAPGESVLFLELRRKSDGEVIAAKIIRLHTLDLIVIVLGGWNQEPHKYDPENPLLCSEHGCGIFAVGEALYKLGYDVWLFDEEEVDLDGHGKVYELVRQSIEQRGVRRVAIAGYSFGGGSVHDLAKALKEDSAQILGPFEVVFTAYVDAIKSASNFYEHRRPSGSQYHLNLYQSDRQCFVVILNLCGIGTEPADGTVTINVPVHDTEWGKELGHRSIDDSPQVSQEILFHFGRQVRP